MELERQLIFLVINKFDCLIYKKNRRCILFVLY